MIVEIGIVQEDRVLVFLFFLVQRGSEGVFKGSSETNVPNPVYEMTLNQKMIYISYNICLRYSMSGNMTVIDCVFSVSYLIYLLVPFLAYLVNVYIARVSCMCVEYPLYLIPTLYPKN